MEHIKRQSLNIGTIIFFIMALLQVPSIINVFVSIRYMGFGISAIIPIAIFVITILFAISLSNSKNFEMVNIYPLILFFLYAIAFIIRFISSFQQISIFLIVPLINSLLNVLCYLFIFQFYKKTNGNDKEPITSVLIISFIGMLLAVGNAIIYKIGLHLLLLNAAQFILLWVFSARNVRVPISEVKVNMKKEYVAVIFLIIMIIGIVLFVIGATTGTITGYQGADGKYYSDVDAVGSNDYLMLPGVIVAIIGGIGFRWTKPGKKK